MNRASQLLFAFLITTGLAGAQTPEFRTFTNAQGKSIQARFVALSGDQVTIEMAGGQKFTLAVTQFSTADQDYIKQAATKPASSGKLFSGPNDKLPPETVNEIDLSKRPFRIVADSTTCEAKTVIIATGATAKRLHVPGTGDHETWV